MFRKLLVGIGMLVFLSGFSEQVLAEPSASLSQTSAQSSPVKSRAKSVAAASASQGQISGVVFDKSTGLAAAGVSVNAKPVTSYGTCEGSSNLSATTDLDGYYTISAIPTGPYLVKFTMSPMQTTASGANSPNYMPQWYKYVSDETQSTVLQVSASGTLKNINALLEKGGSISGNVSDTSGPLSFANVTATSAKGIQTVTTTDMSGNYTMLGLASGSYTVTFKGPPSAVFNFPGMPTTPQYPPGQYATPVVVTAPNDTPKIDMIFTQVGGTITGTVSSSTGTLPSMMMLSVRDPSTGTYLGNTFATLLPGFPTFKIGGLASGTYDLMVNDFGSNNSFTAVKISGVVVTASKSTDVGTVALQPGGQIKGVAKSSDGTLMQNVYVMASNGHDTGGFAMTAADGSYTINGLATGNYNIQFSICSGGYLEQWYNGKASQAVSDSVLVTAPAATSGIDVVFTTANANVSPVALSQSVSVITNISRSLTLSATDANSDRITFSVVTPPSHGTLSGTPPNLTYTPVLDYSGSDVFTFKANDGKADSNVAAVSLTVSAVISSSVKGDVNGDGSINVLDALLTLQYTVGLIPKTPEIDARYLATADVAPLDTAQQPKGDGKVDIADALMILKRVLNLEPWLPAGGGTALSLVTPQNGATDVAFDSLITVASSKILDALLINESSALLQQTGTYGNRTVAGVAVYDAARREISFGMTELQADYLYNLVFTGLKDVGGFTVADSTFSFKTRKNPFKVYSYKKGDGSVQKYNECKLTTTGDPLNCRFVSGAGADGIWFTPDDTVLASERYDYDGTAKLTKDVISSESGTDVSYGSYMYDSAGRCVRYTKYVGPGPDGTWFTADDTIGYYIDYAYNSDSRLFRVIHYAGPGPDGIWVSQDDVVSQYEEYRYDPVGRESGHLKYSTAGKDAIWFTADDTLSHFNKKVRNIQGRVVYDIKYSSFSFTNNNSGQDIWSGGGIVNYREYIYDTSGRVSKIVTYADPGADNVWHSQDDIVAGYCTVLYDSTGNKTTKTCYINAGSNGVWFDADDVVISSEEFVTSW
jgi:hypothetical protein